MIGRTLGAYRVIAKLGEGGMGEVYRARDDRLGRDVALKVLPPAMANAPEALARFAREARAIAAVSHPNILTIYDTGREGAVAYVATELVEGRTLRDALAGGPLPRRKAIDYAAQIARGLAAAHERGIVHRDLKPENVIVGADGHVKVLDFGLARGVDLGVAAPDSATVAAPTAPGLLLGTVGYLAPEQARGSSAVDHRADVFSLGCVLYEMVAGCSPFGRDTAAETLSAVLRDDAPPLPGAAASPGLDRLIARCLDKSPAERFQSTRDLAFALEGFLTSSSISGTPTAPAPRRRRRWLAPAGLLLVAVAAVGGLLGDARAKAPARSSSPHFTRLSFERGTVRSARFSPDGTTIVYGAAWDGGPLKMFVTRADTAESAPLNLPPSDVLSVSASGELAVSLGRTFESWVSDGTLARAPLLSASPRPLAEHVRDADWIQGGDQLAVVRRVGGRDRLEFPLGHVVYETSGYASHPRVSADGTRTAFLDHPLYGDNRGYVALVDTSGRVRRLTPEYGSIEGLAWSPDGREVWFSGGDGIHWAVLAVGTTDQGSATVREIYEAPIDLQLLDVRRNGQALVSASILSGSVTAHDTRDVGERNFTWGAWSVGRIVSADGRLFAGTSFNTTSPDYDAYIRFFDGSPPVPMGHGEPQDISADGKWLLIITPSQPPKLRLTPIGPGESRPVEVPGVRPAVARFFPDGGSLFVAGTQPEGGEQWLRVSLTDGHQERIAHPQGMDLGYLYNGRADISPDSRELAHDLPDGTVVGVPLGAGAPRTLLKLGAQERFLGWGRDPGHVFVAAWERNRARVYRVTLATGLRDPLHDIALADPAGALITPQILMSRSGDAYVYWFTRMLGSLYLVEGLR